MGNWFNLNKSIKESYKGEPEHLLIEYINFIDRGTVLDLEIGTSGNSQFISSVEYDVNNDYENNVVCFENAYDLDFNIKSNILATKELEIEENKYSLITVSWVLNFFDINEVNSIIEKLKKGLCKDGVIYLKSFSLVSDFYTKTSNISEYKKYYSKDEILSGFSNLDMVSFKSDVFLGGDLQESSYDKVEYMGLKNI